MEHEVLVVGGGITGCAAAWHLAGGGADVVLVEEFDLNTQASGRNAGSLHGQIQFTPFVEWGEDWARSFLPALRFLAESLEIWRGLGERLGVDLEVSLAGGLLVASTPEQMRGIERKVALEQEAGIDSVVLDSADLQAEAPYVSADMAGAGFCRLEGKANPLVAAPALARAARRLGATIHTGAAVNSITWERGLFTAHTAIGTIRAPRVVMAAGNGINRFADLWGTPLPITWEAIQASATEPVAPFVKHLLYYAGGRLTLKQARAGTVLIGGGWAASTHPETGQRTVDPESLRRNMQVALHVVPDLADVRLIRTWAGDVAETPDLLPIVGPIGPPGLVVGMYPHLGFTAAPLLGRVLADLVLDRSPDVDLASFSPNRF